MNHQFLCRLIELSVMSGRCESHDFVSLYHPLTTTIIHTIARFSTFHNELENA